MIKLLVGLIFSCTFLIFVFLIFNFLGKCKCKSTFVQGNRCDQCQDAMFDLTSACTQFCSCDPYGSQTPICDKKTGQCVCKPNVYGIKCKECARDFFNLTSYGCVSRCGCYVYGSLNVSYCNKVTGQCECKVRN